MHEGSIAESIIDSVTETVEEQSPGASVREVHLLIGVAQGVVPESLQFFFDEMKADTPLAQAALHIETQPIVGRCASCDADHTLDMPVMYCPVCGAPMEMAKGNEIMITAIEVDE
jgi:hydrogenase nickel incorporation protein HypA/HybF